MNTRTMFVRAALAAACAGVPAAGLALDLLGSYQKALAVDADLQASRYAVQAGREKAVQGDALMRPQVALSAGLNQVDSRSSSSVPAPLDELLKPNSSGRTHKVALQLQQPLYDRKSQAEKAQAHQQAALAEISFSDAQQDLLRRVAEAYFELLLAQEHLRVVQAEKAAVAMQRDRAQARFDVGRGKATDLQEAQARFDGVVSKEVSARSTLSLRQARYEELTGAPPAGLAELAPAFTPAPPQPDDLPAWQRKGMERNTRVLTMQQQLLISDAETRKYTLDARPTLDLVASLTQQGQNGSLSPLVSPERSRTASIGLQLNVPLYTGGALSSKARESVAKRGQAEQELAAARRDARLQVQDAFLAVNTGVSRVAALSQSVRSAQTALEATTLGRDVGSRTELDVLDAQQRLFSVQLELAQARHDHLLGRVRLAAAAGELGEAELLALNAYLVN